MTVAIPPKPVPTTITDVAAAIDKAFTDAGAIWDTERPKAAILEVVEYFAAAFLEEHAHGRHPGRCMVQAVEKSP